MPVDYAAREQAVAFAIQIMGEQNYSSDELLKAAYGIYNFLTVEDLHEVE